MAENVVVLTDDIFEEKVLKSKMPVLVDFWAAWCMPCSKLTPIIEELSEEYKGKVKFGKVNVDECPSMSQKYGIRSIPTLLIFKNGKVISQIIGVHPKRNIQKKLKEVL